MNISDDLCGSLIKDLIASLPEGVVAEARSGIFTTAVVSRLENGRLSCGLASSCRGGAGCPGMASCAGKIRGMSLKKLASLAGSGKGQETALGLAAINAALPELETEEINAEEILAEKARGRRAAVIGHFPFVGRIRKIAGRLDVFELAPKDDSDIPSEKIPELLSEADVVAISAMTLVNRTFGNVIANCRRDSFKILLGPSAPLSPIIFDYGIDIVSGTRVADIPALLNALSEGVNFRSLPGKKLVTIRKKA